ncbi:MAG: hypothetical protein ACXVIY_07505 [Mucilaginibacter sp.]
MKKKPEVESAKSEVKRKAESTKPKAGKQPAIDNPYSEVNKSEIENSISEIKEMEVHHHPRLDHNPKPWKEYILEGLMIFLAVTMGFFAESLREHIGDNSREKEFAKALYTELYADSVTAAEKIQLRLSREGDLDYLGRYFKDSSLTVLPRQFYPTFAKFYLVNIYTFEPKDGILSQLRNSGSLRYFKSVPLQKLLGDLSVAINNIRNRNDQEYQFFASPLKPFLLKHFDFNWINQLRQISPPGTSRSLLTMIDPYLKSTRTIPAEILDVKTLDRGEASNMAAFYKQMQVSTRTLTLNDYIQINKKILQELRQTYPLD